MPALAFDEVVKHYRTADETVRAADGVTLDVAAGELVALFGPSGSGKSTLLAIAAGLLAPDSGQVLVSGRDITRLSARDGAEYRKRELGFITQDVELLGGASAITNAALKLYGLGMKRRDADRRVALMLERLGLGARLNHRPHQLSMGERQRVMIVRALSTDPVVVLADEPTGALDSERTATVLQLLRDATDERGIATVLVTHDAAAAAYADRVFTLRDGRLTDAVPATP